MKRSILQEKLMPAMYLLLTDESGQGLVEYTFLLGLIALATTFGLTSVGKSTDNSLTEVQGGFSDSHEVVFQDENGEQISKRFYGTYDPIVFPKTPKKAQSPFVGWSLDGENKSSEEDIHEAIASESKKLTLTPLYSDFDYTVKNGVVDITGVSKQGKAKMYTDPIIQAGTLDVLEFVSLTDKIGINLYIPKTDSHGSLTADYTINCSAYNGKLSELQTKYVSSEEEYYFIQIGEFAAKEMTDDVEVIIFNQSGAEVHRATYSIQGYCEDVLNNSSSSDRLKNVCKATLDYGSFAQLYFGYKTGDLANRGEIKNQGILEATVPEFIRIGGDFEDVSMKYSLSLQSQVILNCYFYGEGLTAESFTFDLGDSGASTPTATYIPSMRAWMVQFGGMATSQLGENIKITVTKGSGSGTWTLSPMNYVYRNQNSATMGKTLHALYRYYVEACAYFAD